MTARTTARGPASRRVAPSTSRRTAPRRTTPRLGSPRRRLRAAVVVIVVMLLVLGGRLVQLQGLEATAYAAQAQAVRMRTTTLPSVRGDVLDRSGHPLARDAEVRLVFGDPTIVSDPDGTAAQLAPLLGLPAAQLAGGLRTPGTAYVPLAHLVDVPTARSISALRLPGIGVVRESRREHPSGSLSAALVGVVGGDGHGASGVEGLLDSTLHGRDGVLREELDPAGRTIPSGARSETQAADGSSVRVTIDRDLQWAAERALAAQVADSGASGGQVVVMDPRTGDVLALASAPSLDLDAPVTQRTPLGLPALSAPYEPGSVNKVITMAAALEAGLAPATPFTIPNVMPVPGRGRPVIDAETHGTEHLTLAGVLAKSSNIGTVQVEQRIGKSALYDALRGFGLGSTSGVGFPGESEGLLPPVDRWNIAQETTIPFGQGMSATGLQIASVYATVAAGGVRVTPRLVDATVSPDGQERVRAPGPQRRVISPATASTLTTMLEQVTTTSGTAPKAAIPGYRIAGKTGTADVVNPATGRYDGQKIASFAGFAPADAPRLVVSVSVDRPTRGSQYGGDVAGPVFRTVMAFALRHAALPPTGARRPDVPLCWGDQAGCGR